MNNEVFSKYVMEKLLLASNAGDRSSSSGNRFIGHRPDIAPKAYTHVLFKNLEENEIDEMCNSIGFELQSNLKDFYRKTNGMMIFSGALRVLGFVPKDAESVGVYDFPSNILIPNVSARITGLDKKDLVVGWYKEDSSYAVIESNGEVTRYDVSGSGKALKRWADFDNWIASEIDSLHQNFKYN